MAYLRIMPGFGAVVGGSFKVKVVFVLVTVVIVMRTGLLVDCGSSFMYRCMM